MTLEYESHLITLLVWYELFQNFEYMEIPLTYLVQGQNFKF